MAACRQESSQVAGEAPEGLASRLSIKVACARRRQESPRAGAFAKMDPIPGAIDAYHRLAEAFDVYIRSTAPWDNPSAWQHKVEWVHNNLGVDEGTPADKRLSWATSCHGRECRVGMRGADAGRR